MKTAAAAKAHRRLTERQEILESTDSSSEDLLAEDLLLSTRAKKAIPAADANVLNVTESSSEGLLAVDIAPSMRPRKSTPVKDTNDGYPGLEHHGTEVSSQA